MGSRNRLTLTDFDSYAFQSACLRAQRSIRVVPAAMINDIVFCSTKKGQSLRQAPFLLDRGCRET